MDLYSTYAEDFSKTRQAPWDGWKKTLKYINSLTKPKVLDLGCGNGRFLKFLVNSGVNFGEYTGVDNSSELLKMTDDFMHQIQATNRLSKFELLNLDFEDLKWGTHINQTYNLIVAFGITHHLKTVESRRQFFNTINFLLEKDGFLIVTFWEFLKIDRYKDKLSPVIIEGSQNDFEMTFGTNGAKRFCHYYNPLEIIELTNHLPLKIMEEYNEDGVENNQNHYIVYKKL